MGRVTRDRSGQPACPLRPSSRPLRVWKASPAQRSLPDWGRGSLHSLQSSTCRGGIKPVSQMRGRTGQDHAARRPWHHSSSQVTETLSQHQAPAFWGSAGKKACRKGRAAVLGSPHAPLGHPPEIQARSAPTYRRGNQGIGGSRAQISGGCRASPSSLAWTPVLTGP